MYMPQDLYNSPASAGQQMIQVKIFFHKSAHLNAFYNCVSQAFPMKIQERSRPNSRQTDNSVFFLRKSAKNNDFLIQNSFCTEQFCTNRSILINFTHLKPKCFYCPYFFTSPSTCAFSFQDKRIVTIFHLKEGKINEYQQLNV